MQSSGRGLTGCWMQQRPVGAVFDLFVCLMLWLCADVVLLCRVLQADVGEDGQDQHPWVFSDQAGVFLVLCVYLLLL